MEVDGGGDESVAATGPVRGKKRPSSPAIPPSDGEDSSKSITSDEEDEDGWEISDSGSEEEAEGDQETCHPFTIDDFPRASSDFSEQIRIHCAHPDVALRGPYPLVFQPAFKGPIDKENMDSYLRRYQLYDTSEINDDKIWTRDCPDGCSCSSSLMLQFFDLKIAGYARTGHAKIFGFFAARDRVEPLRNYVYRREIDNSEAVTVKQKTGIARLSLTSPARGICHEGQVLFEFKLNVRTEDSSEDGPKDELLIEGCALFSDMLSTRCIKTHRVYGEKCGLDMKFAMLFCAVQANVDVAIVRAPKGGFKLNLYAKTSGFRDVISLYRGVADANFIMSSVVAVMEHRYLELCIKDSPKDGSMWQDNFLARLHGTEDRQVNLDEFTTISVKVTWKAVRQLE